VTLVLRSVRVRSDRPERPRTSGSASRRRSSGRGVPPAAESDGAGVSCVELAEKRGQVPAKRGGSARCPPNSGIAALITYLAGEGAKNS
jgi:hypothetical protein